MRVRVAIVQVVRMDFHLVQSRRVATVNVVRHLEHVINVVLRRINIHVAEPDMHPEVELRVVASIRVVIVVRNINGVAVHVHIAEPTINMRVV